MKVVAKSKPSLKLFLKAEVVGFADRWNLGCERGLMVTLKLAWATGKMELHLTEMGTAVSRAGLGFCCGHVEFEVPVTHPCRDGDHYTNEKGLGWDTHGGLTRVEMVLQATKLDEVT